MPAVRRVNPAAQEHFEIARQRPEGIEEICRLVSEHQKTIGPGENQLEKSVSLLK